MTKKILKNKNKSINMQKTLTIKKVNKVSRSYSFREDVRNPNIALILKISDTRGSVKWWRIPSIQFIVVVGKGVWGTFLRIGLFLKYMALSILWVAAIILMGWLEHDLGDYSDIFPGDYLEDFNQIDLSKLNIDFGIDSIDFRNYSIDLNRMFEMGLEIPFISELDDLNMDVVDVHEKELSAWDKWLTVPSYPFDWVGYTEGHDSDNDLEGHDIDNDLEGYTEGQDIDNIDIIETNIRLNSLAYKSNNVLNYDVIDIFSNKFIVTNDAILNYQWFQSLIDIASNITVTVNENGDKVTNLTINTGVANAFIASIDSGDSLGSESLEYENAIRAIRSTPVVINSPEFREMFEAINGTTALSIVEVSPPSPEVPDSTIHSPGMLETLNQMRADFRESISLLFSHQIPDAQPMPSWFEVPTRPTEPWAIEIWEKDNVIRNYWANRLNGGYTQTNVIIGDIELVEPSIGDPSILVPEQAEPSIADPSIIDPEQAALYTLDWFYDGYNLDTETLRAPSDIFDEESLYLDLLFNDSEYTAIE
jgi:hypothetical protein